VSDQIPGKARDKVKTRKELLKIIPKLKKAGKKIVFTNGCFDLLHPGHVRYLETARELGDILVVALNSDDSVRRIKGEGKPFVHQSERAEMIGALCSVSLVTTFSEDTPQTLIEEILPDVLVKGGDWSKGQIVGRETVEKNGGRVVAAKFERGFSTTGIVERIRSGRKSDPLP
jgi:D-beta-D-heptose 7-phosphate kinase/D-beta-D-heptose 1-phosphate adenosyltransferase